MTPRGPSLTDTLAWMDSTYNHHIGGSFGYGELRWTDPNGKVVRYETESFTYDGCKLTLKTRGDLLTPAFDEHAPERTDVVDLGNVDPNSLRPYKHYSSAAGLSCDLDMSAFTCDSEILEFLTRNDLPLIAQLERQNTAKGVDKTDSKTFAGELDFNDTAYAKRFEAAFRHAIDLCGGRRSTF
jgi:hypothetical protein